MQVKGAKQKIITFSGDTTDDGQQEDQQQERKKQSNKNSTTHTVVGAEKEKKKKHSTVSPNSVVHCARVCACVCRSCVGTRGLEVKNNESP